MEKAKLNLADQDPRLLAILKKTDHKVLGIWAADCAERVLLYFEKVYPKDKRPRNAIKALREWVKTGIFHMKDVRHASLSAHAAARVSTDSAARFAARACGQAMATAHVPRHSLGSAMYALLAINEVKGISGVNEEREWQYEHLLSLKLKNGFK